MFTEIEVEPFKTPKDLPEKLDAFLKKGLKVDTTEKGPVQFHGVNWGGSSKIPPEDTLYNSKVPFSALAVGASGLWKHTATLSMLDYCCINEK